jgi:hypothetical protein
VAVQWLILETGRSAKTAALPRVGNALLLYYRRHPLYLFSRLYSMLRYGFSNRYLTCVFSR